MNRVTRLSPFALLALAVLLSTAGCKSNQNATSAPPATDSGQTAATDSSSDPASANLAPVATTATQTAASSTSSSAPAAAAPSAPASSDASSDTSSTASTVDTSASVADLPTATDDDTSYGQTPVATAPQPPPALPEYQQPAAPGDDYLWTPGYWNYASAGYYWVPGVWVQAPYQGALWTPGYWGYTHGRYGFFHGYWGPHIGFYGGINYGFGYIGTGYQGGYWRTGHFFYNRSVNNINVTVVHNVYEYRVVTNNNVHISFNGGRGGLQVRARPAELVAAFREPHAAPMRTQVEIEHTASINKANFVSENHGRPTTVVIEKPIVADRDVHPVPPPARYQAVARPHGGNEAHPNAVPPARGNEPGRPEGRPNVAPPAHNAPQPERREVPPAHNSAPPAHNNERPVERPAPHAESHPAAHPQANPPKAEERSAPHANTPAKPAPQKPGKPEPPKRENEHPQ